MVTVKTVGIALSMGLKLLDAQKEAAQDSWLIHSMMQ